jgi:predicted DNA-binding protein (MmcQ/YjbR family)
MDAERLRKYLLSLPHVVETMQWGANLVFWVGDKAIGGKMFALVNLDEPVAQERNLVLSYALGAARYGELLEREGLVPAPYMARIHWVAAEGWEVFTAAEWQRELRAAYEITLAKLPPRTRKVLALPAAEQRRMIAERRKRLATRERGAAEKTQGRRTPARDRAKK